VDLPPDVLDDLRSQLRDIADQVRALETMVADGRDCRAIVNRIAKAHEALEATGFRILSAEAVGCLTDASPDERGEHLQDLQQMLQRLA
jgi:DNA-binding FrmR family transcriptional regulator